jgi:hypothetical protein
MSELEPLSVVALLEDFPGRNLQRGQVGTVVERLAPGVYEIEFSGDDGCSYASLALRADQLLTLHHNPTHQAAQTISGASEPHRPGGCHRAILIVHAQSPASLAHGSRLHAKPGS